MSEKKKNNLKLIGLGITTVLSIMLAIWQYHNNKAKNYSKKLELENVRQQKAEDSLNFAHYRFETTKQLNTYLDSNLVLKSTIKQQGYKLRHVQSIVISQTNIIDSIKRVKDASPIIKYIRESRDTTAVFNFNAPCLDNQISLRYENDSLTVSQDYFKITHNDTIIGGLYKDRKMFLGINWSWLPWYKKYAKVTKLSECGETKVIVIDKKL